MATHARPVWTAAPARGLAPRRRQALNLTPIPKPYKRSASRGVARTNEQLVALNSQSTERDAAADNTEPRDDPAAGAEEQPANVKAEETGIDQDEAQEEMQRLRERHLTARRRLRSLRTQQIVAEKKVQAVEEGADVSEEELKLQAERQAKQEVEDRVKMAISASEAEGAAAMFSTVGVAAAGAVDGLESMTEEDQNKVLNVPEEQKVALSEQLMKDAINVASRAKQLSVYSEADRTKLRTTSADLNSERAKSSQLGGKLQDVTSKFEKSTQEVASLQKELQTARSDITELKDVEQQLQLQLKETRERLMAEKKSSNSFKQEGAKLRGQLSNAQGELNSANFKLEQERAKSEEKDEAISALKKELSHSIDTFEAEQDKSKQLNMDLIRMQRDLSTVKSEKEKAEARVEVLSGRIKNAEARAVKYQGELQSEREMRTDATEAVMKLQEIISSVKAEKNAAITAASNAVEELGEEKAARAQAERDVSDVKAQLESIKWNADQRAAKAHEAMQAFRDEIQEMKSLEGQPPAGQNNAATPGAGGSTDPKDGSPKTDAFYSW